MKQKKTKAKKLTVPTVGPLQGDSTGSAATR